jgi:IrrE N-terminal-like domain
MTDHGRKPIRWANDLNTILAAAVGEDRFPVPVERVATEYSNLRFKDAPIVAIDGRALGRFEGALYPVKDGKGWAIIYNTDVSDGRRRFTVAHEFGHYLMHRPLFPNGLECSEEAVTFRNGDELEVEADTFAAYLLMPLDDFRRQIPADADPNLDDLSAAAERYGVSLIACVLRWLEYTTRRSMLVISRDGFILWARPSKAAFKSGLFIRTKNVAPVEVPSASLLGRVDFADIGREGVDHPPGVWFNEDCTEITIHSDKYDQSLAILHFGRDTRALRDFGEADEPDAFDRFNSKPRRRFE